MLVILDGLKALRKAVGATFGDAALVQQRFGAAFTPTTTAPIISSSPMTVAPGAVVRIRDVDAHGPDCQGEGDDAAALTLSVNLDVPTTVTEAGREVVTES